MIRVDRPAAEPPELAAARAAALPAMRPNGPANRKELPSTYKVAHGALWRAQQRAWQGYMDRHVVPSAIFAGLSRDVAALEVSEPLRRAYGLTLPHL